MLRKLTRNGTSTLCIVAGILLSNACSKQDFGRPETAASFAAPATYNAKVDVLLLLDNSSSMVQYQNRFANEVMAMLQSLNNAELDYRIGIITTDMRSGGNGGRLIGQPAYLTAQTPNVVEVLKARVVVGQSGSDLERGLESVTTLLRSQSDFVRPDAFLAIVALTNEDDYSATSLDQFIAELERVKPPMKGFPRSWIMNFIGVVSIDGQCSTIGGYKEAGLRYMALADLTGGIKESICQSSLARSVQNLKARLVEVMSEYQLDRIPELGTIRVFINGVLIPEDTINGWSYQEATLKIRFHGSAQPKPNDQLRVEFTPRDGT